MANSTEPTLLSRLDGLLDKGRQVVTDGWTNVALGFGTPRDKTSGGVFTPNLQLYDDQLAALYAHDDVAAKIVNIYPREAMRKGYALAGFDPDILKEIKKLTDAYHCDEIVTDAAIWSRLFGGGAVWAIVDDGLPASAPMGKIRRFVAFKFYDRRWLTPVSFYNDGPMVGEPETYMLSGLAGNSVQIGAIHESRLIRWPGARTELLARRELNWWDYSVLQAAFDAIKSSGNVWKAIEILVTDANQGVFKVKNLWSMLSGKQGEALRTRATMMDLMRSAARAIMIDKDSEEFERQVTQFAGLADLDDRGMRRVARAAEIPVSMIASEQAKGLNASGDSELLWFWARVQSDQSQVYEPRILRMIRILLSAKDSPVKVDDLDSLALKWHPLWEPTSKERAEIDKLKAETAQVAITTEMVLPEEAALSLYGSDDPGLFEIDSKARQKILEGDMAKLLKPPTQPVPVIEPGNGNQPPNNPIQTQQT